MNCAACYSITVDEEDVLHCSLIECDKVYHTLCTGNANLSYDINTWVCPECRCLLKSGGDNSHTPVGVKPFDPNVTMRRKTSPKKIEQSPNKDIPELYLELRDLKCEIQLLKNQLTNALKVIANYEVTLENQVLVITKLSDKIELLANAKITTQNIDIPPPLSVPSVSQPDRHHNRDCNVQPKKSKQKKCRQPIQQTTSKPSQHVQTGNQTVDLCQPENLPEEVIIDTGVNIITSPLKVTQASKKEFMAGNRKSHHSQLIRGTAGPSVTSLRAVESRKYIHLWNMESSTDEIHDYLEQICPMGKCTIQALNSRGNYKSYKIGVLVASYEVLLASDIWPVNAKIRPWINFKKTTASMMTNEKEKSSSQRSFRAE